MSLVTPTTQEIADNILAQLEAAISQTFPLLPKSFTRVLAKVLAGVFVLLYKYAGFIFLQLFIRYASFDETEINGRTVRPLVEWGRQLGMPSPNPFAAVQAEHTIEIQVTNQTGVLQAFSQLVRPDTEIIYQTLAEVPLDAATKSVDMVAVTNQEGGDGAGSLGNLESGDTVEFVNPLPNVAKTATVTARTVDGTDAETEEQYRARLAQHAEATPQGGAYADYRGWAREVPGIINVYPYTGAPGEVDVYSEATEASSGSPDGIPTQAQLDAVEASINFEDAGTGQATRRPANAAVNSLPISRTAFDVVISNLQGAEDPAAVQSLVEEGLDEYFRDREPVIIGLTVLPRQDRITTGSVSGLTHEIVSAEGATVDIVLMQLSGSFVGNYTLGEGEKAKLGTVTWL